jgi:hypothetical protein
MNNNRPATRIVAGVLPAMALFATAASAQEAVQPAPPTVSPAAQPAAPAAVRAAPSDTASAGPSAADRAKYDAAVAAATGTATTGEAAAAVPATAPASVRPAARRPATARSATPVQSTVPSPTPAAAPAAPPVAATPALTPSAAATPSVAPAATEAPAAAATETTAPRETTTVGGAPLWGWVIGGLVALGLAVFGWLALRRRREDEIWEDEPAAYDEAVAAPLITEPVAEHVEVVTPEADEVAAITQATAPVAGRPWIELSLRPVRAGSTEDSATIDLELTLANAGTVAAQDVRVSTFMVGDAATAPTDLARLLAMPHQATEVSAGEIGAGQGSRG